VKRRATDAAELHTVAPKFIPHFSKEEGYEAWISARDLQPLPWRDAIALL
jgi:hypothetical protein